MAVTVTTTAPTATTPGYNTFTGTNSADYIIGTANADLMFGGEGNDWLVGGDGVDGLEGGPGVDHLMGGRNLDVFYFADASYANFDVIMDFRREDGDLIDLSFMDARSSVAGDQAFSWIGTAPFTAEGQLHYFQYNGNTYIQGNTSGDLNPEFIVSLYSLVNLIPSDFIL